MGLFHREKNTGAMDVIRCDEPNYLIWKWRPSGEPGNRENAIRWGSSLRVKEGSVAVFVYSGKDGSAQDYIEGPRDEILHTKNLPVLASIIGAAYNDKSPFQAEVYFINLAQVIQTKIAVPFFEVFDPRFMDFGVPVAVRGTISYKITDYKEFIKLHRLDEFTPETFSTQITDAVSRYIKNVVANAPAGHNIPVIQLERKINDINSLVEDDIRARLAKDFGVTVTAVDIATIEVDKTSDAYRQLLAVTKDVTSATIGAQTAANVKNIYDTQRIQAEDTEGRLRMDREETAYARHKDTQTANLTAYQLEAQESVGVAGAEALGKMGASASMATGGNGGMNPAAMMAGMVMGGAIGHNVAGVMNGMRADIEQPAQNFQAFQPAQPSAPAQPVQPITPVQPAQPAVPSQPAQPTQPNTPPAEAEENKK